MINLVHRLSCKSLPSNQLPAVVSALTGLAAFNVRATKIHGLLSLPVEHGEPENNSRLGQEQSATIQETMTNLRLLIVDGVNMISSLTLLCIHLRLTEIMCCPDVFGGVSVHFLAALLQLSPAEGDHVLVEVTTLGVKARL